MAKKKKTDDEAGGLPEWEDRKKQWCDDDDVSDQLLEMFPHITQGYEDKSEQKATIEEAWDCFNCRLSDRQFFSGDSQIYMPIIHDAVEARVTRFGNMVFPMTGRYSEVTSSDGKVPYETMSILDYYVEKTGLRDVIVPSLLRTGDITGQYSLLVSWKDHTRYTIKKTQSPLTETDGLAVPSMGTTADVEVEKVSDAAPDVQVIDPRDLLIMPPSVDEVDDADLVVIALRMSKGRLQSYIDDGTFDEDAAEDIIENMSSANRDQQPNPDKKILENAGVKDQAKGAKTALVYMVWTKLKLKGKRRSTVSYITGSGKILSIKRNPYWCDRVPVLSQAALKVNGSIWGTSRVKLVAKAQYAANDFVNMGMDSSVLSLQQIIAIDPERNPRSGSIVIAPNAVWQCAPDAIKIIEFPHMWKDAAALVSMFRDQVMQTLGVNPAMMPSGGSKKPSQAQVQQEQMVAIESTADVVTILEQALLNKLLRWFYELDCQYREHDLMVRKWGPVGIQAEMQEIAPIQVGSLYNIKWYGTEGMKSQQQIQAMVSFMNVLGQMPPEKLNGRKIDMGPIIDHAANVICGPRIGPKTVIDQSHMLGIPPDQENEMLLAGFHVMVQAADNDLEHMKAHIEAVKTHGDHSGVFRLHITEHQGNMAKKNAAMQPQQGGGGGQAPRAGAQTQMPTGPQRPDGAVHPDQMMGGNPTK